MQHFKTDELLIDETMRENLSKILILGIDLVGLASSAKTAGYKVYAVDYFGDHDLKKSCNMCFSLIEQKEGISNGKIEDNFDPSRFLELSKLISHIVNLDAIFLSSGLDDSNLILKELDELAPILGNPPNIIRRVRDKEIFFRELEKLGIHYPTTVTIKNVDEAKDIANRIGYPLILKPHDGFSGVGIRKVLNEKELENVFQNLNTWSSKGVLIQEFIKGVNASVSFIASDNNVSTLTLNEQLLGLREVFQTEPFGYCGNNLPLDASESVRIKTEKIVEKIAKNFNLRGSNGIDLVITSKGEPYVIEVNPRFQGTLECVERVLNLNLVQLHIDACIRGVVPINKFQTTAYSTRIILYTPYRVVAPDLRAIREIRDIPMKGSIIEKGEPLCSVVTVGKTREASIQNAWEIINRVYRLVKRI